MALLRDLTASSRTPQTIMEVPGKVYIEGQAHDATTLSPIFNDTFSHFGSFTFKTSADVKCVNPISMLYSKFGAIHRGSTNLRFLPVEFSFVDGAQNSVVTAKAHINQQDMVFIPHNDMYMSAPPKACHVKLTTGEVLSKFDTIAKTGPEGAAFIFRETADHFFVFSQPYALDESTSPQGGAAMQSFTLYQVSKEDGTTTILKEGAQLTTNTSATAGILYSHLSTTDSQSYFVEVNVNTNGTTSTAMISVGSDGRLATGPTYYPTQMGANSYPSNSISISSGEKVFYTLETGGSNYRFSIVTYDASKRANSGNHITNRRVVPTNSVNMPAVTTSSGFLGSEFRTNVFTTAQYHYIVVTNNSAKTTGAVPAGFNYIHVYRAPLADPYTIEYVSSTKLGENLRISSTFPLDSNFSKFAVIYHDGGIEFVEWNQTAETYVINGYSNIKAEYFGVDQLGRFWVLENGLEPDLHVFNPSVARTVRIGFAEKTAKFDGTPVEVTLMVSAFGYEGERTESNVVLTIDGTTATFLDGSTTSTITTELTKDATIKIRVVGSGQIQVLANITA